MLIRRLCQNSLMKSTLKLLLRNSLLVLFIFGGSNIKKSDSQSVPPPPPADFNQVSVTNRGPMDSGAPLGDGAWILITLAMAYGIHTFKFHRRNLINKKEE